MATFLPKVAKLAMRAAAQNRRTQKAEETTPSNRVRGPITAVMGAYFLDANGNRQLQWVRGPITAVMYSGPCPKPPLPKASMGPRSDNRGYASRSEM